MLDDQAPKIIIIGCGNVAWHLASRFSHMRCSIGVYNHRANPTLSEFTRVFGAETHSNLNNIENNAAFYFICVPDRYIATCAKKIHPLSPRAVVAHTSGSVGIEELGDLKHGTAVFYPLQTFSRSDAPDWKEIPLILEGNSETTTEQVRKLANHLSENVVVCSGSERAKLHLAAVLVNNFTNALYTAAFRVLADGSAEKRFELLLPLIRQTVSKAATIGPHAAQTGPARRGDKKVMKKHMQLLGDDAPLQKLYKQLSQLIVAQHKQ